VNIQFPVLTFGELLPGFCSSLHEALPAWEPVEAIFIHECRLAGIRNGAGDWFQCRRVSGRAAHDRLTLTPSDSAFGSSDRCLE